MSAGKREALEVALRRTLGFHLGVDGVDQEEDWELLVCALLDAAEEATLRDGAAVGREFANYLPGVAVASPAAINSKGLPQQQEEGEEGGAEAELYEDVLRLVSVSGEGETTHLLLCTDSSCSRVQLLDHELFRDLLVEQLSGVRILDTGKSTSPPPATFSCSLSKECSSALVGLHGTKPAVCSAARNVFNPTLDHTAHTAVQSSTGLYFAHSMHRTLCSNCLQD